MNQIHKFLNFMFTSRYVNLLLCVAGFAIFVILSLGNNNFYSLNLFRDESHAWTIAQYCSLSELYKLMHIEGHMLLWYLVLMPFAKLNWGYPFVLKFINWFFALGALVILWKKFKISPYIKFLITVGPIFSFYSVYARCYAIGIFFLFLACAMYKDRLKYPYRYFILLLLAANTSLLALFCALGMGIVFLLELFVEKIKINKDIHIPVLISFLTILTGIFLYFQFFPVEIPSYTQGTNNNAIRIFFKYDAILSYKFIFKILYLLFGVLFLSKPKVFFVYLFSTIGAVVLFLCVYKDPHIYHLSFFFIYLLVCSFIYLTENMNKSFVKYINITMFSLCILLLDFSCSPNAESVILSGYINKSNLLSSSKLYTNLNPVFLPSNLANLNKNNIFLYDLNNRNLSYYEGLRTYYNNKLKYDINYEKFVRSLDKNRENYLITNKKINQKDTINKFVKLKFYKKYNKYYFYKIIYP